MALSIRGAASLKVFILGSHYSFGKCVSFPTPVSNSIDHIVYPLCPWRYRALSSFSRHYVLWSLEASLRLNSFISALFYRFDLYAILITCCVREGMLNLTISLKFCKWAGTKWTDSGQKEEKHTVTSLCIRGFQLETVVDIQKREPSPFQWLSLSYFTLLKQCFKIVAQC